jgi:hypothetical protein
METKTDKNIGLTIPDEYYRKLKTLRRCADNMRSPKGRPITNQQVYLSFRTLMEKLNEWLLDAVVKMGYGNEFVGKPFQVIGLDGLKVTLKEGDNPFECYWTTIVIDLLSEQFRFGGLLEQWQNDP